MPIPTIQVEVSAVTYSLFNIDNGALDSMTAGTPFETMIPARIYPQVTGNSPLYGPGSARYEITGVTYNSLGLDPAPIAVDPKTFIDNYGYIHVGPSNMPKSNADYYTITFKAIYSYIDPSTGDVETFETANLQIRPLPFNLDPIQENNTAIQYLQQPGYNG